MWISMWILSGKNFLMLQLMHDQKTPEQSHFHWMWGYIGHNDWRKWPLRPIFIQSFNPVTFSAKSSLDVRTLIGSTVNYIV
jgi:hypothetical protein